MLIANKHVWETSLRCHGCFKDNSVGDVLVGVYGVKRKKFLNHLFTRIITFLYTVTVLEN